MPRAFGVELFGFAVAFFVGYGGSMEEYKDLSSSFTTLFDTLLGASDISGLVNHDYVLVTLLFFPFVMMNTFVVLSMFLTVIGLSFDDVRDPLSVSPARRAHHPRCSRRRRRR